MSEPKECPTWLKELYPGKELSEVEVTEAKSNLLGFFSLFVEINNDQNNDQTK